MIYYLSQIELPVYIVSYINTYNNYWRGLKMVDWTFNDKNVFGSSFKSYIQTVFSCHGFFLGPFHNANGNDLEMKLKYLMLVLVLDGQIEIKWTIAMFIPEHKQRTNA